MKTKVTKIIIQRAEGMPSVDDMTVRAFASWDEAHDHLVRISHTAPEPKTGTYDKCDFSIRFADGELYEGRFDLQKGGRDGGETLQEHVRNFLLFYAGKRKPAHFKTEEQYLAFTATHRDEAVKYLETYDI